MQQLLTNSEIWPLIHEELKDLDNFPLVSANVALSTERSRVTYKVQHPVRKIPQLRQASLSHGQVDMILTKLRNVMDIPNDVVKVEINLLNNDKIEPFIRYTVKPLRRG